MIRSPPSQALALGRSVGKSLDKAATIGSDSGLLDSGNKSKHDDRTPSNDDDEALSTQAVFALQKSFIHGKVTSTMKINDDDILGKILQVRHLKPHHAAVGTPKIVEDEEIMEKMLKVPNLTNRIASRRKERSVVRMEPRRTVSSLLKREDSITVKRSKHDRLCVINVDQAVRQQFIAVCYEKTRQEEDFVTIIHEFEMLAAMEEDGTVEKLELEKLVESLRVENRAAQEQFDAILSDFVPSQLANQRGGVCLNLSGNQSELESIAPQEKVYPSPDRCPSINGIEHGWTSLRTVVRDLHLKKEKLSSDCALCSQNVCGLQQRVLDYMAEIEEMKVKQSMDRQEKIQLTEKIEKPTSRMKALEDERNKFSKRSSESSHLLKDREVKLRELKIEIEQLQSQAKELEIEKSELQLKYATALENAKAHEKRYEQAMSRKNAEIRTSLRERDARIMCRTRELARLKTSVKKAFSLILQLQREKEELARNHIKQRNEFYSLIESKDKLLQEKDAYLLDLVNQRDLKETVIRRLEQQRSRASKARKTISDQQQREKSELMSQITSLKEEISALSNQQAAGMEDLEPLNHAREKERLEADERISELSRLKQKITERENTIHTLKASAAASVEQLQQEKDQAHSKISKLEEELNQLQLSFTSLQDERDSLRGDIAETEHIMAPEKGPTKDTIAAELKALNGKLVATRAHLRATELAARRELSDVKRRFLLMNDVQKRELSMLRRKLRFYENKEA